MLRLLLDANDDPDILVFIVFSSSSFAIHFSNVPGKIGHVACGMCNVGLG